MGFVPLEGWGGVEAGPIIGAVVDKSGGPVLLYDIAAGVVRPLREDEKSKGQAPQTDSEPVQYALASRRTGQTGRQRYESGVEAVLAWTARPDGRDYMPVQVRGDAASALSPQERERIDKFLVGVGLGDRRQPGGTQTEGEAESGHSS